MSLPQQFTSASCYFEEVLQFLQTYQWIYNYPNTDILLNRVFENFPSEWMTFFKNLTNTELNDLSIGIVRNEAPESLKLFLKKINSLKPYYESSASHSSDLIPKKIKISQKKHHEIVLLSSIIHDICKTINSEFVIDVGSGLGYLPEFLHENYNCTVLGLEGSSEKLKLALERQNTLYPNTKTHIKYCHNYVTESSATEIKQITTELFPLAKNTILTGLHACADLSITVLKLFLQIDSVKGLVIMPCCYHRLELLQESSSTNNEEDRFKNFPVSDTLKRVYNNRDGARFLRRYFLRLACQQSVASFLKMSEEEHRMHGEQCLFRAILEVAAKEENCSVSRNKRKTGRPPIKDSTSAIEHYINNLKNTHTLTPISAYYKPPLIDSAIFRERMLEKWHQHKDHCYIVEVLTALQMAIQSVCENLVLLDRVVFLRERGVECRVNKVTDDRISPRCYALVATKL